VEDKYIKPKSIYQENMYGLIGAKMEIISDI
jgi:hypothetical protein